jgi:hypothetical protein
MLIFKYSINKSYFDFYDAIQPARADYRRRKKEEVKENQKEEVA